MKRRVSSTALIAVAILGLGAITAAAAAPAGGRWMVSNGGFAATAGTSAGGAVSLEGTLAGNGGVASAGLGATTAYQFGSGYHPATQALRGQPAVGTPPESDLTTSSITWSWTEPPEAAAISGLRYSVLDRDAPSTVLARGLASPSYQQTGLTPNLQKGVLVVASTPEGYESSCYLDMAANQLDCSAEKYRYTLAAVPGAPAIQGVDNGRLTTSRYGVTITVAANGNPAGTEYAVYSVKPTGFLDGVGAVFPTPVFLAQTSWRHDNLSGSQWQGYQVRARNGDGIETADSAVGYGYTPPAAVDVNTYVHVSQFTGSDATGDGSYEKPYATIGKGLSVAGAAASPTNEVLVLVWEGNYSERVQVPSYVVLRGRSPLNSVIDGSDVSRGADWQPVVQLSSHSKVIGMHIRGAVGAVDAAGAGAYDVGDIAIIANIIEGVQVPSEHGVRLNETGSTGGSDQVLIQNNTIVGQLGHAIYLRYPGPTVIDSNIFVDNGGAAIYGYEGSGVTTATVTNNQAWNNGSTRDGLIPAGGVTVADPMLDMDSFIPADGTGATENRRGAYEGDFGGYIDNPIFTVPAAGWWALLVATVLVGASLPAGPGRDRGWV